MATTGKSKTCVWRWQERFMAQCADGLLREKARPLGTPRTSDEKVGEVIRLTQKPPPHEATHWTIRAMGKAVGLAASTVREIWKAHGLSPHRWRQFKLSNDRAFAKKLHDVVGLYVSPPAHAVVLSVDEKSHIQALDRTQPGLPLKKVRGPTITSATARRRFLPRSTCWTDRSSGRTCSATGIRSSSGSSIRSNGAFRQTNPFTPSSTTTARRSTPTCGPSYR